MVPYVLACELVRLVPVVQEPFLFVVCHGKIGLHQKVQHFFACKATFARQGEMLQWKSRRVGDGRRAVTVRIL